MGCTDSGSMCLRSLSFKSQSSSSAACLLQLVRTIVSHDGLGLSNSLVLGPYWFPVLNPDVTRWVQYFIVFAAHLYAVESLAILVAGLISNFILGLIVFSSLVSQLFVYNGFFISLTNMPVYFVW